MIINIPNNLGYVTDEVSSIKVEEANASEENRIKFITDVAAISRGKSESSNPEVRYKHLLKEAAPVINSCIFNKNKEVDNQDLKGSASRPLEFLPVVLKYSMCIGSYGDIVELKSLTNNIVHVLSRQDFFNKIIRYSYTDGNTIYTNMRALINADIPYENIPYNKPKDLLLKKKPIYSIVKIKAPMYVFNHLITHTALSKESRSERVVSLQNDNYYVPYDLLDKINSYLKNDNIRKTTKCLNTAIKVKHSRNILNTLSNLSSSYVMEFLKEIGYPKEIYQRAMLEFRYKEFVMGGYNIDPYKWEHLFIERNTVSTIWKNWTQSDTSLVVKTIKNVILGK